MSHMYQLSSTIETSDNGTSLRGSSVSSNANEYYVTSATVTFPSPSTVYVDDTKAFGLTLSGGEQASRFQAATTIRTSWNVTNESNVQIDADIISSTNTGASIQFNDIGMRRVQCTWDDGYNAIVYAAYYTVEVLK